MSTEQLGGHEIPYQQLERLVELSMALNSTLDLDDLLERIVTTAAELLNCEAASILLYDERNPRLYFAAATGSSPAQLAETPVPIDGSLAGTIFRTGQHLILNDVEHDPRHYSLVSEHIKFKVKSLVGVPMSIRERTVGVLEAVNKLSGRFDERDAALLSVTAAHAAVAIDNARSYQLSQQLIKDLREVDQLIEGKLSCSGNIRLDGEVQGDISSQGIVIIGENGGVNGQINADSITIGGKVTGTVRAKDKVVLEPKANLKGDIITKTLLVEAGAIFNGNSKMGNSGSISDSVDTSKPQDSIVK